MCVVFKTLRIKCIVYSQKVVILLNNNLYVQNVSVSKYIYTYIPEIYNFEVINKSSTII